MSSISAFMTQGFDSAGYALVSQDYNYGGYTPSYSLPTGGSLTSLTSGLHFQLADYSGNNALRFHNSGDTGTLAFVTPQNAGAIYVCGLSGSGASDFEITVNFSDGTSQLFSGLNFPDWYASGGSVVGIGRVSTSDNHTEGSSTAPSMFEVALNLDPANYAKIINSITIHKTTSTGYLGIMAVSAEDLCSGTPTAGTVNASQLTGCGEFTSSLSISGTTAAVGITYQWQTSTDGVMWTSISGATSATYAADVTDTTFFRAYVTCTISGLTDTTSAVELEVITPVATVATLPYTQDFESWMASCYSFDRPDGNWLLDPTSGNNSWRRDDQGSDATWTNSFGGGYTPVSTTGAHSARFHSYYAPAGAVGNMDLHIDLSPAGTKQISFDYQNSDGDDQLTVQLSEDGGTTFTTLQTYTTVSGWVHETMNITSTAANAVIRLSGTSDYGYSDIGVDNFAVIVLELCSGTPAAGTITASVTSGCSPYSSTISLDEPINMLGIAYQWQTSADGVAWSNISGETNTIYNAPSITANTYFRAYVTCSYSGGSDTTAPVELYYVVPTATAATLPFFESFENWIGTCFAADRPGAHWLTNPASGDDSWRRDDQGDDASWAGPAGGTYSPVSTDGGHSARFHSYIASPGSTGNMDLYIDLSTPGTKQISFDYHNSAGADNLQVQLSEDGGATFNTLLTVGAPGDFWSPQMVTTTSVAANAIIRFLGTSDDGNSDIGVDSLAIWVLPACSGTPVAGVISASTVSGCSPYTSALSLPAATVADGISYQWQSSADGVTWTNVAGATTLSYSASVTATVYYRAYVACSYSSSADTSASVELAYVVPTATVASLPFFESFENWIGTCYAADRPGTHWLTNPSSGDDSWRRDDQGTDASWSGPGGGSYSPASTDGGHSARFHSYLAPSGSTGNMDLYIDLSTPGTKQISFDYHNNAGPDNLQVQLSEDGGTTFNTLLTVGAPGNFWAPQMVTTNSVAANAIIRFLGTSDDGGSDLGLDSLSIFVLPGCTGTPVAGTVSASVTTGCVPYTSTVSLDAPGSLTGISYQWQSSADGATWTNVAGATGSSYTASVTASVHYRVYEICNFSGGSDTSSAILLVLAPEVATVATLPFFEGFESWTGACYNYDRPGTNWLTNPTSGNNSWRRDDQGSDASWSNEYGAYTPASAEGSHSARFHSYYASAGDEGDMDLHIDLSTPGTKTISFDYHNADGDDVLNVQLSEDGGTTFTTLTSLGAPGDVWVPQSVTTTSVAPNAIIRFAAISDYGGTDIGIDSLYISGPAAPSPCAIPAAVTASGITTTGATISWTAVSGAAGYQYTINTTAAAPATPGTATTATTVTVSGLASATTYYAHVRTSCSATDSSAWVTIPFTTLTVVPCTPVSGLTASAITYYTATISWDGISGVAGYQYVVNTTSADPTTSITPITDSFVDVSGLLPGTTYYAHVRTDCGSDSSVWVTISFTTPSLPPCAPVASVTASSITYTSVVLNWSGVSGAAGYLYVVNTTAASPSGGATETTDVTASVGGLTPGTTYYAHVRTDCGSGDSSTWVTISFTTLSVATCDAPTGLSVSAVTSTTATASWTAVSGAAGYQYVINTTAADPAGAGTPTTLTSVNATSLIPSTVYYVHVRTDCGSGTSVWVTVPFITDAAPAPCDAPAGLTVTGITSSGATASWTAVAGAAGYQYVVNTTAADPTSAGTATTATSVGVSSLAAATIYYVHVRTTCTSGDSSAWVTVSFTTLPITTPCDAVTGLTAASITDTSAVLSWGTVAGATGYEYVIDNNVAAPSGSGTFTTATSFTDTSLLCNTTYHLHVRTDCSSTTATWSTISFTTALCPDAGVVQVGKYDFAVQAYPNPSTDRVTVEITGSITGVAHVQLTDVAGKVLATVQLTGNKAVIDLANVAAGVYFLNYTDDINRRTIKINKQ